MTRKKRPDQKELLDRELAQTEAILRPSRSARETEQGTAGAPAAGSVAASAESSRIPKPSAISRVPGYVPFLTELGGVAAAQLRDRRWIRLLPLGILGIPSLIMLAAMYLASKGIYIDPLRPLWAPVPSEDLKWAGAGLIVIFTLWYAIRRK